MLSSYLIDYVEEHDISHYYFQQDGATCHTCNITIERLNEIFPNKIISINGDIEWPPRSPDMNPLDYFLWGHLKQIVYQNKPRTITELKNNIISAINNLNDDLDLLERVIENFKSRIHSLKNNNGGHLIDLIYKK
jgi:hypothetical protein